MWILGLVRNDADVHQASRGPAPAGVVAVAEAVAVAVPTVVVLDELPAADELSPADKLGPTEARVAAHAASAATATTAHAFRGGIAARGNRSGRERRDGERRRHERPGLGHRLSPAVECEGMIAFVDSRPYAWASWRAVLTVTALRVCRRGRTFWLACHATKRAASRPPFEVLQICVGYSPAPTCGWLPPALCFASRS